MEFQTINSLALRSKIKGNWKPLFKSRFISSNYEDTCKPDYENNLRNRIFNNSSDACITHNEYPFNLGESVKQLIIWISDEKSDPGINKISELIEFYYPNVDYTIIINKPENRSIKTILHYHAIIKEPSEKFYLKKLIIFHRHANRWPILQFPIFENNMIIKTPKNIDVPLLFIGEQNAKRFGQNLKEIYQLDDNFLSKVRIISSPSLRCEQTSNHMLHGLQINNKITINYMMRYGAEQEAIKTILNSDECKDLHKKYENLLNDIGKIIGLQLDDIMVLYDVHSSIVCYRDIGFQVNKYISIGLEKELNDATLHIHNFINNHLQDFSKKELSNIVSFANNFKDNLILCSSHDTLIFLLAKYYAINNKVLYPLELPAYLSNIRIEQWSDNKTRIYYNNYYLSNKIIL